MRSQILAKPESPIKRKPDQSRGIAQIRQPFLLSAHHLPTEIQRSDRLLSTNPYTQKH